MRLTKEGWLRKTMTQKAKCVSQVKLHEGYLRLANYEFEIPSFHLPQKNLHISNREIVHSSDSILVLIYAPASDSFILCQEFRPGVFLNESQDDPFILECVSGTIEKNTNPRDTAIKEVYEETGLKVEALKLIAIVYKSPGLMTEKCYLYYTEVKGIPAVGLHGVDSEEIKTHCLKREKVYQLMDEIKIMDSASLIALNWFRANALGPKDS
ncbi:NUDIX domain-containing protein [Legionella lansingensis]|nr:NUDIX domain-containing protein [Legionella lansingensis]